MSPLTNGNNWTSLNVRGHFRQHKGVFDMDLLAPSEHVRQRETQGATRACSGDPMQQFQLLISYPSSLKSKLLGQSFSDERADRSRV